jgi:hypothetical protein
MTNETTEQAIPMIQGRHRTAPPGPSGEGSDPHVRTGMEAKVDRIATESPEARTAAEGATTRLAASVDDLPPEERTVLASPLGRDEGATEGMDDVEGHWFSLWSLSVNHMRNPFGNIDNVGSPFLRRIPGWNRE